MIRTKHQTNFKFDPIARFTDPETGWTMYREITGYDDDGVPTIVGHDGCPTLVRADKYRNYGGLVMFAEGAVNGPTPPARYLELDGCLIERFSATTVADWHDRSAVEIAKHGDSPYGWDSPDEVLVKIKSQITEL